MSYKHHANISLSFCMHWLHSAHFINGHMMRIQVTTFRGGWCLLRRSEIQKYQFVIGQYCKGRVWSYHADADPFFFPHSMNLMRNSMTMSDVASSDSQSEVYLSSFRYGRLVLSDATSLWFVYCFYHRYFQVGQRRWNAIAHETTFCTKTKGTAEKTLGEHAKFQAEHGQCKLTK